MTTKFTIPNSTVSLELPAGVEQDEILKFPAFKKWFARIQQNLSLQTKPTHEFNEFPYSLQNIKIEHVDRWGPRIGFIKFTATVKNAKNEQFPGSIFLRGPSVGMLVILQPEGPTEKTDKEKADMKKSDRDEYEKEKAKCDSERYVLLTSQPRIAAGGLEFLELPAGMVDNDTFNGAAANEIEEELQIKIKADKLINMSTLAIPEWKEGEEDMPRAMFPSAGGCDEYIQLFLHEMRVPREDLDKWTGKLTGLREDGEKIKLKLVKMEDLWWEGARDAKALAALSLWENLRRTGKLYKGPTEVV